MKTPFKHGTSFHSLSHYYKERYGEKIYKLSIDAGFTCPTRDGSKGTRGCIFCSSHGSGDFTPDYPHNIASQIHESKLWAIHAKGAKRFIVYFQAYTNTYAPISELEALYREAMDDPDIVGISIATRPDCIDEDVISLLSRLNKEKDIYVELGLQTIHPESTSYIRRGYPLDIYDSAVEALHTAGIPVITHLILGLPHEDKTMFLETVRYICQKPLHGIKLQLLHILSDTDLYTDYLKQPFHTLQMDEYIDWIASCLPLIPEETVIYRLTGDGAPDRLVAPKWSLSKRYVLNRIHQALKERDVVQGSAYSKEGTHD